MEKWNENTNLFVKSHGDVDVENRVNCWQFKSNDHPETNSGFVVNDGILYWVCWLMPIESINIFVI